MKIPHAARANKRGDSTLALINIVFLMLIFFLVAGTIVPQFDRSLNPVVGNPADSGELKNVLVLSKDGILSKNGAEISVEQLALDYSRSPLNQRPVLRILPDRDVSAEFLIDIIESLKNVGFSELRILVERGQ